MTCSHLPNRRRALRGPPRLTARRAGSKASRPTQPGPIALWAASIQAIAAPGDSASRLSIARTSRSGRRRRRVRMSDPRAKSGEKRARRRRRRMTRFEKFRARGADGRLAPGALARRLGALGGAFRLGRQRGDPLIEPRRALIEIAAPFAGLEVEQPRAAQEKVREPERAPEVERDRQCAKDVEDFRRPVEPFAVGRDPVGDRLERYRQAARSRRAPPAPCSRRPGRRRARRRRSPRRAAGPGCRRPISRGTRLRRGRPRRGSTCRAPDGGSWRRRPIRRGRTGATAPRSCRDARGRRRRCASRGSRTAACRRAGRAWPRRRRGASARPRAS